MAQLWDASATLVPLLHGGNDFHCCGWALTPKRRCRNPIKEKICNGNVVTIRNLGYLHPRGLEAIRLLRDMLPSTLCRHHKPQAAEKLQACLAAMGEAALGLEFEDWSDRSSNASTDTLPFDWSEGEDQDVSDRLSDCPPEYPQINVTTAYPSPPPTPPRARVRYPVLQTVITTSFRNETPSPVGWAGNEPRDTNNMTQNVINDTELHSNNQPSGQQTSDTTNLAIVSAQTIYSSSVDDNQDAALDQPGDASVLPESITPPNNELEDGFPDSDASSTSEPTLSVTFNSDAENDTTENGLLADTAEITLSNEVSCNETTSIIRLLPTFSRLNPDILISTTLEYGYTVIIVAIVGFARLWSIPRSILNV